MAISVLYWINPYGKILKQGNTTHIQQVVKNPAVFGVNRPWINKIYKRHDEIVGNEGKAREEIMEYLFKRGFIRVRLYVNKYWSVTLSGWTPRAKKALAKWAEDAQKDKSSGKYMPVKILDTKSDKLYQEWTVEDLLYDKHINEGDEDDLMRYRPEIVYNIEDLKVSSMPFREFMS